MSRRKKFRPPFDMMVESLGERGVGIGHHDGHPVHVRGAAPGTTIRVHAGRARKGILHGRKVALISGAVDGGVTPKCEAFGLCGGCTLQELSLTAQRREKQIMVESLFCDENDGFIKHEIMGDDSAWEYRNKFELTFGVKRYLSDEDMENEVPMTGRFLGFHAAGRFDRIVESSECGLMPEGLREVVRVVKRHLKSSNLEPWNVHEHTGFWRHLVLRETTQGEKMAVFYTSPTDDAAVEEMQSLAAQLTNVDGVLWYENPRVADAAIGELRAVLSGRDWITERLGNLTFKLSPSSFFQTNTKGAEVLYEVIRKAALKDRPVGIEHETLLDLYCGTGSIGLSMAGSFSSVVGVELNDEAVEDARANAARNNVENATFHSGAVRDVAFDLRADVIVVDPPRVGLHPKVSEWLPKLPNVSRIVYVACKPASLARDREIFRESGWVMTDLWTVDMFPQTGHVEAVGLFVRAV
jgi:23S rRNA (uracil1939-C5)-methyltransferase